MFHVSQCDLDGMMLYPRVPNNYFTRGGWEDNKTPRVCFADDICGCLSALSKYIINSEFNVYVPDDTSKYRFYMPGILDVPDVEFTREIWSLDPINVVYIGRILITDCLDKRFEYGYGDGRKGFVYRWNYRWLDK